MCLEHGLHHCYTYKKYLFLRPFHGDDSLGRHHYQHFATNFRRLSRFRQLNFGRQRSRRARSAAGLAQKAVSLGFTACQPSNSIQDSLKDRCLPYPMQHGISRFLEKQHFPDAPCMEYLPTFAPKINQM